MTKPPTTPAPDLAPGALLDGVDLARQLLAGLSLRGASLRGARLDGAHLQDVDLTGADLSGAHLAGAILERVMLDEAHLDGVQAAGLDWSGGSLARAQVAGLQAPGAHLRQVHLDQAHFTDAILDGAFLEECEVRELELDGGSLVALRLLACRVAGLRVQGCDLGGAEVLDARLDTLALAGGSLRGARIERAHLARLSLGGCALTGAVFDRCRGLGSEDERVLRAGGAVVLLPAAVGVIRALTTSRRLQIGVAAGGLLLVAGGAVVPSQPALWPDLLLAGRIRTLVDAGDCAAMDTLAQRLGLRVVDAERPRFELFEAVATCRADAQRAGEGEALLREVVASAGGRRAARLAALGALARFQARFGADADLDTTCAEALDLAEGEGERLQVLRLEESLLRERGLGATPRGPGEPAPEDARWLRLQRDLAVALAASEDLEEGALHGTAADLYVLGEWSLAEGLLVGLDPAAAVRVRCQAVDAAARRLAADGRPDLALALLAQQRVAHPLDPQSALILTRREVGILLAEGRIAEAEALLGPLPEDAPVALVAETGLLRAAVLEAAGQPRAVLDLLAALPTPIPVAFDHVARRAWLTARAWRALGREDEAVVALEPLLTAASSDEIRESMRALGLWAATLAHPEALLDLLGRVENPALLDGLLAADLTLELVRARAEAGLLAWDDPLLTRLFSGDPALAAQALAIALDRARAQGTVPAAVPALLALVAAIDDASLREAAGLDLAQAALDASAPAAAAEALDRLRLAQSADPDRRARAEALRAGIALGQDDPAQALASVEALLGRGRQLPRASRPRPPGALRPAGRRELARGRSAGPPAAGGRAPRSGPARRPAHGPAGRGPRRRPPGGPGPGPRLHRPDRPGARPPTPWARPPGPRRARRRLR
ncbi:MAG: pentapeptide repeat-containing protein, partial [Pseudomonadota bacterium]